MVRYRRLATSAHTPDYAPEEIKEIAQRLREQAGLPKEPTGEVANGPSGLVGKVADKLSG